MELEEGLLTLTEIESSLDYNSKRETSTVSILSLYTSSLSTPPLLSLLLPSYNNIHQLSQKQYKQIIWQYQKQITTI